MPNRSPLRTVFVWLVAFALSGAIVLIALQHRQVSRLTEQNNKLRAQSAELDRLRAEAQQAEDSRNLEAEIQRLQEDNRDLLRLRNEVGQLREQVKELDELRKANASLLQALQSANLSTGQQSMVVAARRQGAVLGVYAVSANDPRSGAAAVSRYYGAVVMGIDTNSPAMYSGLKAGDVIVRVDGRTVENVAQLQVEMLTRNPGDTVTLDVMRNDTLMHIPVQTRSWPK
jgi:C-terminal processing protease CtpA/Prc